MFAPSIAQPSPNDNHDTMCADWQGTRLAVNQQMPSLTVITEAGAAAQTPFPYSILGSEIRLQNQFYPLFGVRCKVLRVTGWGHGLTGVQNASWDDCAVTGPSKYNHYFQNG